MERARAAWKATNNHMDALVTLLQWNIHDECMPLRYYRDTTEILQRYYKYVSTHPVLHYSGTPTCTQDDQVINYHSVHVSPQGAGTLKFDSQPRSQPPPPTCSWPLTECGSELLSLGYITGRRPLKHLR